MARKRISDEITEGAPNSEDQLDDLSGSLTQHTVEPMANIDSKEDGSDGNVEEVAQVESLESPINETSAVNVLTPPSNLSSEGGRNESGKEPANIELKVGGKESGKLEEVSRERIEASMMEKLSRRTDSDSSDPFVPQVQLEKEVIQISKEKGFPLSRGTEIGARLIAKSNRKSK